MRPEKLKGPSQAASDKVPEGTSRNDGNREAQSRGLATLGVKRTKKKAGVS
jgi:hypothetical protein